MLPSKMGVCGLPRELIKLDHWIGKDKSLLSIFEIDQVLEMNLFLVLFEIWTKIQKILVVMIMSWISWNWIFLVKVSPLARLKEDHLWFLMVLLSISAILITPTKTVTRILSASWKRIMSISFRKIGSNYPKANKLHTSINWCRFINKLLLFIFWSFNFIHTSRLSLTINCDHDFVMALSVICIWLEYSKSKLFPFKRRTLYRYKWDKTLVIWKKDILWIFKFICRTKYLLWCEPITPNSLSLEYNDCFLFTSKNWIPKVILAHFSLRPLFHLPPSKISKKKTISYQKTIFEIVLLDKICLSSISSEVCKHFVYLIPRFLKWNVSDESSNFIIIKLTSNIILPNF